MDHRSELTGLNIIGFKKKLRSLIWIAALTTLTSCKNKADVPSTFEHKQSIENGAETPVPVDTEVTNSCNPTETLVFEDDNFKTLTEDEIHGNGIVLFDLQPGDKLSIFNHDGSDFGTLKATKELTFQNSLPKQLIARNLIPNSDFASFAFDAEAVTTDDDYLLIFINKSKKKVKKSDIAFSFKTWDAYILSHTLQLKECNLLRDEEKNPILKSKDLNFDALEVKGDSVRIKSTKTCLEDDASFQNMEGWIQWKSGNNLLVNFAVCN